MKKLANSFLSRVRQRELQLAKSVLRWKLQKEGRSLPGNAELDAAASRLLEQARDVARRRGKNLYDILKEEAKGFFSSKPH
ncbi:MAG: hypothetical protein ACLFVT_04355 [Syntrophobacteria bacterium]